MSKVIRYDEKVDVGEVKNIDSCEEFELMLFIKWLKWIVMFILEKLGKMNKG